MPNLRIITTNGQQRSFELVTPRCTIGRSSDCDLHLDAEGLSRHHACVYITDGQWRIQDLGSANGTSLNGRSVEDNPIGNGDTVSLGDITIVFEADADVPVAEIAPDATEAVVAQVAPAPAVVEVPREVREEEVRAIVQRMAEHTKRIEAEISKAIIGQKEVIWQLLTAIVSSGHVLMIGMPGLAKTMTIRTLSEVLDLKFRRIQFTPDLMPSDITGTDVLEVDEKTGHKEYRFIQGPIFTNILLADEINRTPPKTQAALLEAMQEHRVTASGHTYQLSLPFFVLATQNPLEQEGTYPLPEAQLDRFMFSVYIDYPEEKDEETIAKVTTSTAKPDLKRVLTGKEILELQQVVRNMPVSDHVVRYAVRLARATRPADKRAPDFIKKYIHCGAGPRASQYLIVAAKARAVINGRLLVSADDVRAAARPVLRHRMFTNFTADAEGMDTDKIVQQLVQSVPEPGEGDY